VSPSAYPLKEYYLFMKMHKDTYRKVEMGSILIFLLLSAGVILPVFFQQTAPDFPTTPQMQIDALASAMPNQGWAPMTVYFSAYGSLSDKSEITQYLWDLDGNGLFDTDATRTSGYTSYTYVKPGLYTVTLQVTDAQGSQATAQTTINVRHPAASSVDYASVFDDSQVRRVDVSLTQENWDRMWADIEAKTQVPANAVVFGERLDNVSFSMRGQFSMRESGEKKPWKINTDAYIENQEFENLKQLIFINNIGDPTMIQEKLAYDLMRFAGVPASHVCYVELWIDISNDPQPPIFWGIYTMIERIDRKFIANRFGQDAKDGNLYKASHAQRGPMDLKYYGENITDYPTENGQYAYGKETNEEEADYSDVIALARVIDGTTYDTPEEFAAALEEVFNVDGFLRYMAVVVATMNWDIYPYTGNNFFLFNDPVSGRFEWIPWDLTWGGDARQPLFERDSGPAISPYAPLYDRVFEVEQYRLQYAAYLDLLVRVKFNEEEISRQTEALHNLIAPYVTQSTGDKMYFGDTAMFPIETFNNWHDIENVARERSEYILSQLSDPSANLSNPSPTEASPD
jgi:PKD repeat protein